MGTFPVSRMSTFVEQGGTVGKWITQLSAHVLLSELAKTKDFPHGLISVRIPYLRACFIKPSTAGLEPIDLVQPRSNTT